MLALLAGAAIVVDLTVVIPLRLRTPDVEQAAPRVTPENAKSNTTDVVAALSAARETIVPDDGRVLWASPTAGPPILLRGVPAGTQVLIHLRPRQIAAHPDGGKALASLGPWGERLLADARTRLGRPLEEFDSLLVAITTASDDRLLVALRAVPAVAPGGWGRSAAEPPPSGDAKSLISEGSWPDNYESPLPLEQAPGWKAFVLPGDIFRPAAHANDEADTPPDALLVCAAELADELKSQTAPPPLAPDLERLIATSDADRLATVIFAPRFLQSSGAPLVADAGEPLRTALRWLTEDRAAAVALSFHWDADFFVELRTAPIRSAPAQPTSVALKKKLRAAPAIVEEFVAASAWSPYAQKVVTRFPAMTRALVRFARSGVDQGEPVLRCYLPAPAGHNLLTAAELALTQRRPSQQAGLLAGADPSTSRESAPPLTIDDKLTKRTTLSFPKDSLQQAIELLAADTGITIEILGGDLQLDGITKNQSFGIDLRDKPAREILLEILLRANPDRTATGPSDPKQKLVYIVRSDEQGRPPRIVVTTRAAAAKRNEALPPVFRGE